MKRIVCYGDSNTWGYSPVTGERYDESTRWSGILARLLGEGYCVIEAGLNGRTTAFDDPVGDYRNGSRLIMPCLLTHKPVDLVIVMLGTNDTKICYSANAFVIARGLEKVITLIQKSDCGPNGQPPKVLAAAPIEVGEGLLPDISSFNENSIEISRSLPRHYARIADTLHCDFISAADYARPSNEDHIHLNKEGHASLAQAFADKVREIFPR